MKKNLMICNNQREFDNSLKCYQTALVTSQWTVHFLIPSFILNPIAPWNCPQKCIPIVIR